jgi:hypothetical protein
MVRTQLQIDEETYDALRDSAYKQHKSISAVVRSILRTNLIEDKQSELELKSKFRFISSGSSGYNDISENHDKYLSEDFK